MKYIAVFCIKNKDRSIVELLEQDTDELAKADFEKMIERLESRGERVIGKEFYEINRSISI